MSLAEIDVTPITSAIIQLSGAIILGFGTFAINRFIQWIGLKNSEQIKEQLDKALENSITYGIQQAQEKIRVEGWDSLDVRNETLARALPYMISRFPDTLRTAGVDLSNTVAMREAITGALERAYPQAVNKAAASPSTPPITTPNPSSVRDLSPQPK